MKYTESITYDLKYRFKSHPHIQVVSGRFLVEITKPMSTTFKQGMNAWCKYTSDRKDLDFRIDRILKLAANMEYRKVN